MRIFRLTGPEQWPFENCKKSILSMSESDHTPQCIGIQELRWSRLPLLYGAIKYWLHLELQLIVSWLLCSSPTPYVLQVGLRLALALV